LGRHVAPTERHSEGTGKAESTLLKAELPAEFEANARRPLKTRMRQASIRTYKPAPDDVRFRSFDAMADCRRWCGENLPERLGCKRAPEAP
jgi:hypothetical protein